MPRYGRSRFARRGAKPIHPTKWCGMVPIVEEGSTGADVQRTICAASELEEFTNPTIVRIRGVVTVQLVKQNLTSTEALQVACGIRLSDSQVLTAGDLLTKDIHEGPWMWLEFARLSSTVSLYKGFDGTNAFDYNSAQTIPGVTARQWTVDVKAMRRVPQNTALTFNYTWDQTAGSPNLLVTARFRALIKE